MGTTGIGKSTFLFEYLSSIAPNGKEPLFLFFEDRYQHIPDIRAVRIKNMSELKNVIQQLHNTETRNKFSCVVIDTADKLEEMITKYISINKEVEIVEEIGFGKGKKYLRSSLDFINKIRNYGLPTIFAIQSYEINNFSRPDEITTKCKLSEALKDKILHDSYLVGILTKDSTGTRHLSFNNTSNFPDLKDSFGLPNRIKAIELKEVLQNYFNTNYDKDKMRPESIFEEINQDVNFNALMERAKKMGSDLYDGHESEVMNVLKVHLGFKDESTNSPKMIQDLVPAQIDLLKVITSELEQLMFKYNPTIN